MSVRTPTAADDVSPQAAAGAVVGVGITSVGSPFGAKSTAK
jgi:hypothetical protein